MVDIVKNYFNKNCTYGVILYCPEKYHGIIISRATLLNRLKDYGLRRRGCEVKEDRVRWCIPTGFQQRWQYSNVSKTSELQSLHFIF